MTLAILIFMGAALAVAAYLILSGMRSSREEQRELERARERAEAARRDAEAARAARAEWEAKFAADAGAEADEQRDTIVEQRDTIVEQRDPRGLGDGLGRHPEPVHAVRTGRFRRRDVPAPFSS